MVGVDSQDSADSKKASDLLNFVGFLYKVEGKIRQHIENMGIYLSAQIVLIRAL